MSGHDEGDEDPIFAREVLGQVEGLEVRIMDLSGANGAEPVEVVRGFGTVAHANAFARRYVRDSVDICRAPGMDAKAVMAAWGTFGEDAEVQGAGEDAWRSANELADFAARAATDAEERNWRIIDPRRDEDDDDAEEDGEA
ncbi:hypothetical protein [Falsiroseomonas sp.]|uniref:hypothetical protein n=1 Tax=Falsiroseomonas sp. TaxID=2870721 RepID=UPI00271BFA0A|nr:hypothetical protein [Falsiroseomonas sp.]MDO9498603.1 hypothetical protein [Falsiroseomonas sp.]MDP3416656.1 hypothetical protein [Falsiroseomonas sp.]